MVTVQNLDIAMRFDAETGGRLDEWDHAQAGWGSQAMTSQVSEDLRGVVQSQLARRGAVARIECKQSLGQEPD